MDTKLEPADILVNTNNRSDPYSIIKRFAIGPYDHVFMYLGNIGILANGVILKHSMLFESNGRGVTIQSLSNRYEQEVVVLRLKSEYDRRRIPLVLEEAIKLASDPQAKYDYTCIVEYVLPRIIMRKFGIPLPIKYHRDVFMICSEAVFEVFYRAGLVDILKPNCVPPMPSDFIIDSSLLKIVGKITLSEGMV